MKSVIITKNIESEEKIKYININLKLRPFILKNSVLGFLFAEKVSKVQLWMRKKCGIKKYYFVMYNIFVWKIEKLLNTIFQRMFAFCLFYFLLLSKNTFHVMLYTCICYWNTFHHKWIIQITFNIVKQCKNNLTSRQSKQES